MVVVARLAVAKGETVSTVVCSSCTTPLLDSESDICPNCSTPAGSAAFAATRAAASSHSEVQLRPAPGVGGSGSITYEQAQRIITLLESRPTARLKVVDRAVQASQVLDLFAILALIVGALGLLLSLVTMVNAGFVAGVSLLLTVVASATVSWAIFTTGSVLAGYIANRSRL